MRLFTKPLFAPIKVFIVMPFRLKNAPTTFELMVNDILQAHLWKFVLVFFDVVLIYNKSLEEHLQQLVVVLEILVEHQLVANFKKCVGLLGSN